MRKTSDSLAPPGCLFVNCGGSSTTFVTEFGVRTTESLAECSPEQFIEALRDQAPPALRAAIVGLPVQFITVDGRLKLSQTQHKFARLAALPGADSLVEA